MDSTLLVVSAVAILLVAGSLPAPAADRLAVPGLLLALIGIFGGAAAIRLALHHSSYVADTTTSQTLRFALDQAAKATEPNVILIDGGSYARAGIDAKLLELELAELKIRANVIKLTLDGGGHLERYRLYQDLVSRLEARRRPNQRYFLLLEIQESYDYDPLAQLENNLDTARAYHFLTPASVAVAVRAGYSNGDLASRWRLYGSAASHALVNGFNVGVAERVVPFSEVKPVPRPHPERFKRFKYHGTRALLRELKSPTPDPEMPRWLKDGHDRRLIRLWKPHVRAIAFFQVPSTRVSHLKHGRAFCAGTERRCIMPDAPLFKELTHRRNWVDAGHLSSAGSKHYTRWLAQKLRKWKELRK